jgi:hypothetical protein
MPKKAEPEKRGPGRPPRAGAAMEKRIEIYLTDEEHKAIAAAAGDEKIATWARAALLRCARRAT